MAAACEGNIGEILFNSEKRLVPFFAVKDKQTGQVSGRILMRRNADAAGPKSLDWEALCRGATGEPAHISPESFERKIHQHLSAIDAKKDGQAHRVLVVGPGFGLSLAAMHKEHPDVDFVGLDVRDWAHALPVTNGIGASKSDVSYVTSHTVIADASPRKCSIPFKDGCFDAVVMHPAVFSLLGDPILTLSELFRVSKPDGKVVGDFGITPEHFDASKVRYFQKGLLSKKKVSLQDVLERHFGATVKTELVPTTIIPEAYNRFLEISGWKHTTPEYKKTTLNIDPEGTYDTGLAEREYVFPRKQRMKKE